MRIPSILAIVLVAVSVASAQQIDSNGLTVRGRVQVSAKADRARIGLEIRGVGSSLAAAFDNARAKYDQLTERLLAVGLAKENLSTSFFRNEKNFRDKAFLSSKRDFQTSMTIVITTDRLDLLEPIAVAISESSVERILAISFELVNYAQLRKDAIARAALAAKEKAELVAGSLGTRLGEVVQFVELEPTKIQSSATRLMAVRASSPFNAFEFEPADEQTGMFSDDMTFEVEVRVVYALGSADGRTGAVTNP